MRKIARNLSLKKRKVKRMRTVVVDVVENIFFVLLGGLDRRGWRLSRLGGKKFISSRAEHNFFFLFFNFALPRPSSITSPRVSREKKGKKN